MQGSPMLVSYYYVRIRTSYLLVLLLDSLLKIQ